MLLIQTWLCKSMLSVRVNTHICLRMMTPMVKVCWDSWWKISSSKYKWPKAGYTDDTVSQPKGQTRSWRGDIVYSSDQEASCTPLGWTSQTQNMLLRLPIWHENTSGFPKRSLKTRLAPRILCLVCCHCIKISSNMWKNAMGVCGWSVSFSVILWGDGRNPHKVQAEWQFTLRQVSLLPPHLFIYTHKPSRVAEMM